MKYLLILISLSLPAFANESIADKICNAYKQQEDIDKCYAELSEGNTTNDNKVIKSPQSKPQKINGKYPIDWVTDRMFWAMDRRSLICKSYWPKSTQMQLECQKLQRAAVPKIQDIIESLDMYSPRFLVLVDCLNLWQKGGSIDLEMIPTCYHKR